jgi:hypothetical protein
MENFQGRDKRILVVVPHFFNTGKHESLPYGSHQLKNGSSRKKIIESSHSSLLKEFKSSGLNYEIVYLGISESSLMNIQVEVSPKDPRYLPWLAFDHAYTQTDKFDFIMVLEDDLELNEGTLNSLLRINSKIDSNKTLIPNRIETYKGISYCTDMIAMPGWKGPRFEYDGMSLRAPINIHSGFLLLGANRFRKAYEERPFNTPIQIIGDFMESAFANMHAYQEILRSVPTTNSVTIKHNDNWVKRMIEYGVLDEEETLDRIKSSINE